MERKIDKIEKILDSIENMPSSSLDKTIQSHGYAFLGGIRYFKRIFADGSAEMLRYDFGVKKWIILCFVA